jgi:hypothetical protein
VSPNQQLFNAPNDTPTSEGGIKAAHEQPINLLDDDPDFHKHEFYDFAAYGKVILAGFERPPLDVEEPRLGTLKDDTARFLSVKKSQAGYDEYFHIAMPSSTAAPTRRLATGLTHCRTYLLYRQNMQLQFPSSKRAIAPTQRRGRPPVLEWASSASPRAGKRARTRTSCSPSSLTSVSADHALPQSPSHLTSPGGTQS